MTLEKALLEAIKEAENTDKEPEAIKLLLMELSGYTPSEFYIKYKEQADPMLLNLFEEKYKDYLYKDIPIQHILGYSYFYGRKFIVDHNVLIPRRETEELVEQVLIYSDTYFEKLETIKAIDLGCGSGCITISLALEEPKMKIEGLDISSEAIEVAKRNNKALESNVDFKVSDLFKEAKGQYDILVSNPPYIPDLEKVDKIVDKEPHVALFGGEEGLDFYELILKNARPYLKEKALIAFEHGYQQKEAIRKIAEKYFSDAIIIQKEDLQGKDRFTFIGLGGVLS
ncbi:Protein-(Glutamine-N5) methyltransferase, release factor-specific [Alteracholeplasma palmae J233]|uniref:peptide chain release factor N(5)-glutamine methyltransferase n=1 Tax=Alteracholeplasma palmae (strain ATCC 49389 / J233) TaxID=1318466 RepID=U4KQM2_ALTPJ|nr:peptide chain release factor N(5)-glutamine methyltransferase [Alteracholeplasma palmae]CCV64825.1 Protein-(Glutamine-N5) methyltransferase, release factor-specific [Alteracholeplasma palmae J233]